MSADREVLDAAEAYFEQNRGIFPRAIVPLLRERFGLSAIEAVEVIVAANRRRYPNGNAREVAHADQS